MERENSTALRRALSAEERLKEERQRVDKLSLAVLDLASKKLGGYPISTQVEPQVEEVPETKEEMLERFKIQHDAYWQGYLLTAQESGRSVEDAEDWLFRYATSQPLPYQMEESPEM